MNIRGLSRCSFVIAALAFLPAGSAQAQITFNASASNSVASGSATSISHVGAGAKANASNGNVMPPLPGGMAVNDLMLCFVESHDTVDHSFPAGWTNIFDRFGTNHHSSIWYRWAAASNTNPLVTHSGGNSIISVCSAYRGVDTTTPFDVNYAATESASDLSVETGAFSPITPGALIVFAAHIANNPSSLSVTTTGGLSWTQSFYFNTSSGSDSGLGSYYAAMTTPAAIGPLVATMADNAGESTGALLALRPLSASGASLAVNVPVGTLSGDVMIASVTVRPSSSTITSPAGWTLIRSTTQGGGDTGRLATYWRAATASEPASYTWSFSGTHTGAVGGIASFTGADSATPIDVESGAATASSLSHSTPTVTAAYNQAMLVSSHVYFSSGTWSPGSSQSEAFERYSAAAAGSTGVSMVVGYKEQATAGATGTILATASNNADTGVAHVVVLRKSVPLTCYTDDFNRANGAPGGDWTVSSSGGSPTAAIVNNRLRLTDNNGNRAAAAHLTGQKFPGAGQRIVVEFDHFAYNGSGADGIALTFSDASVTPVAGAYGGSLGYAQRNDPANGFAGGWIGIGIDEYGNYSNPTEGRTGSGTNSGFQIDAVAVRGSGSGTTGYKFLAGSGTLSPGIDNNLATSAAPGYRYRITLDHTNGTNAWTTVERDTGTGYLTVIPRFDPKSDAGQAGVPANWFLSYTGSTGGSTNIHEIDNFRVCAATIVSTSGADHIRIEHDGSGGVCTREAVTFKACGNAACSSLYAGGATTLTPITSPAGGLWYTAATGGSAVSSVTIPASAAATYYLAYATPNNVTLGATSVSPAESNGIKCKNTTTNTVDTTTACVSTFSDISYVLSEDASSKIAGTYVAVAGRAHDFKVTAVKWDGSNALPAGCGTDTGYAGAVSAKMSLTRNASDPGGAAPSIGATAIPNAATTATIPLTFTNGVATFNLATSDVGKYMLNILDDSKAYSKNNVSVGGGQDLTVRPFALAIWNVASGVVVNPAPTGLGTALDTAVARFIAAGDSFGVTAGGYRHSATADSNDDGVPDAAATLAQTINGGLAPSFSVVAGTATGQFDLVASRYYNIVDTPADPAYISTTVDANACPASGIGVGKEQCTPGATTGSLATGTITFVGGVASPTGMSFNEVGFFKLVGGGSGGAAVTSYLGTSGVNLVPAVFSNASTSSSTATQNHTIGRFVPKYFVLSKGFVGNRADLATTGSITSGSTSLTVASATGISAGMTLVVAGAGASGGALTTAVSAVAGMTVMLSSPAVTTVTNAGVYPDTFSYMNEPFFASFQLTAVNTAGATTQNYTGAFARLSGDTASTWTTYGSNSSLGIGAVSGATPLTPRIGSVASQAGSFTSGVGAFSAQMALARLVAPDGPYDITSVGVAPLDADGVALSAYALDAQGATSAAAPDGTNERGLLGQIAERFGRLWLGNAYGSDRSSLQLPYEFQYWNGSAFIRNTIDRRSALSAAATNIGLGNYQNAISSANMGIGNVTVGANVTGAGSITVAEPAAAAAGSLDLVVDLGSTLTPATSWVPTVAPTAAAGMAYLRGKWYGASYDRDPTARATFGVFGSSLKKGPIYIRENF